MQKHVATLRVVTMPNEPPLEASDCEGTYTCPCAACRSEVAELVKLGVRSAPTSERARRRAA